MCALPKVDIMIPCYGTQSPHWWSKVLINLISESGVTVDIQAIRSSNSMMPDNNKNGMLESKKVTKLTLEEIQEQKARGNLTDINRVNLTKCFMSGNAEWSFWIDDDTVPPPNAIASMLKLKRPFVSGLYFLDFKHTPVAYMRQRGGSYSPIINYSKGTVMEVDAVGMGCALIHRSVFEKIQADHRVMMRPNGSLIVLHKSMFRNDKPSKVGGAGYVENGIYHMPLSPQESDDDRPFPFFQLEYSRTEDMHFCELCANVGIRPVVDTTLICGHVKTKTITEENYRDSLPGTLEEIEQQALEEEKLKGAAQ